MIVFFDVDLGVFVCDVGQCLQQVVLQLVIVESCSGGWIVKVMIDVVGLLVFFDCGMVVYSYEVKQCLFGVCVQILEQFGVVSWEIVLEMVFGVLVNFGVGMVVVVIGIVGFGGGSFDKLVGSVWIGWKQCGGYVCVQFFQFDGDCEVIWWQIVYQVLMGIFLLV